jgi:hypothetical protein
MIHKFAQFLGWIRRAFQEFPQERLVGEIRLLFSGKQVVDV